MNKMRIGVGVVVCFVLGLTAAETKASETLTIKGDFRYRHELIDQETQESVRNRQRIRARLEISSQITETWTASLRLASGSDDPVSTNQTLTGGFSTKPFALDLAFFEWSPNQKIALAGGKMNLPFAQPGKTELLWDGDLNPEGLSLALCSNLGKSTRLSLTSAMFWVEERKADDDALLYGAQGLVKQSLSEKSAIWAGVGFYAVTAAGYAPFFDSEDAFGNSTDAAGAYLNDFNELELSAEWSTKVKGLPFSILGDYVTNTAADENHVGWLVGFSLGKAKEAGSASVSYNYRSLEKDAVIGVFTDSDFIGGGTDGKGHELEIGYMLNKKVKAAANVFLNQVGVEDGTEFKRVMLDISMKLN